MFLVGKRNYRELSAAQMAAERTGLTITRATPEPTLTPIRPPRAPRVQVTEHGVIVSPKPEPTPEPEAQPTVKAGARVLRSLADIAEAEEDAEVVAQYQAIMVKLNKVRDEATKVALRNNFCRNLPAEVPTPTPLREPTVSTPPKFRFIRPRPRRERGH